MNFIQKDKCHLICTQTFFKIIVQLNYHISIDKMNYSVPYEYVGKKVEAKISKQNIVIYYKGTCIASHRRLYGRKNQYSTNDSHMPKNHQYFSWNADRFINWGESIGPNTKTVIEKHIKLADKYTAQRLENACAIALEHIPNPTYKNIRLILEAGQDEMISKENEDDTSIQEHAILRGADYYRRK